MSWTEPRVETLRQLWASGLSCSQIAAELGDVTRNSVIGKVHRLGLSGREPRKIARAPRPRKPVARKRDFALPTRILRAAELRAEQVEEVPHIDDAEIPIGQRRTLMELTSATCRWPCGGEGANTWFCGGQALEGESYCHGHWLRAYTVEPRRAA